MVEDIHITHAVVIERINVQYDLLPIEESIYLLLFSSFHEQDISGQMVTIVKIYILSIFFRGKNPNVLS